MATQLQLRKGSTSANLNFTGAVGEVTVDTQKNELRVHDGTTAGGHVIYTKTDVDAALDLKANASTTLVGYGITDGANTDLSNLTSTGQDKFDAKANKAMNNLTTVGNNIANWSTNVTNCITEISQDISLELLLGILTIKEGTKLYVPNGFEQDGITLKFDEVTIENDITWYPGGGTSEALVVFYNNSTSSIIYRYWSEVYSGNTAPTATTNMVWYDTTNNVIKLTTDSGSTWENTLSFPICIVYANNDHQVISINQVFNGFGYVGSTTYVLPGVKGIIPNGRNANGTLNNTEISITAVKTVTPDPSSPLTMNKVAIVLENNNISYNGDYKYNEKDNLTFDATTLRPCCYIGSCSLNNSKVYNFRTNSVFHAIDYNNTEFISYCAAPSNRTIELTLGVSGSTYKAPSNGWFYIEKEAAGFSEILSIQNQSSLLTETNIATATDQHITCIMPVSEDDSIKVNYSLGGATIAFRFIYANGSKTGLLL